MKLQIDLKSRLGHIEIYANEAEDLLYVIPRGYISLSLVKRDLEFATEFDKKVDHSWKYIVNTSYVKLAHPLNVFILRRLSRLSKMSSYIVYAPNPMVRTMLKLTTSISTPDLIITNTDELEAMLNPDREQLHNSI